MTNSRCSTRSGFKTWFSETHRVESLCHANALDSQAGKTLLLLTQGTVPS